MKRILSFGAHPDDIELGCGGTEMSLIDKGYEVFHAHITSGERGSQTIPQKELAGIREKEARAAAKLIGAKDVFFMGYPDGLTDYDLPLRIKLIELIREIKPEIVFTHTRADHFRDHEVSTNAVISAIRASGGPWYQETKGKPHQVQKIYGYEVWYPLNEFQLAVDISPYMKRKIEALKVYESQMGDILYYEAFEGLAKFRGTMSLSAKYAEVFEVISAGTM